METKEEEIQTQADQLVTPARADAWQVPLEDSDIADRRVENISGGHPEVEWRMASVIPSRLHMSVTSPDSHPKITSSPT